MSDRNIKESNRGLYKLIKIPYQGTGLKISKIHKYFVYTSRDGHLVVYDQNKNKNLLDLNLSDSSLWNVFISDDEKYIIAGGVDGNIYRVKFPEGEKLSNLTGHTREINHCVITKNNQLVYSASDDGTVRVWNWKTTENRVLLDHSCIIYAFDLSTDEKYTVSGDSAWSIKCLNINEDSHFTVSAGSSVWCLKFSPDGFYFVSGNSCGGLDIWTIEGQHLRKIQNRHRDRLRCIDYYFENDMFVSTGNDHLIKFWKASSFQEEVTFDIHTDWIKAVCYDKENDCWASISDDRLISVVRLPKVNCGYFASQLCSNLIYLRNLKHLLLFYEQKWILCDLVDGEVINSRSCEININEFAENAYGNVLVFSDYTVRKLSPLSLEFESEELKVHSKNIVLGTQYVLYYSDECVKVFDSESFIELFSIVESIDASKKMGLFNEYILLLREKSAVLYKENKKKIEIKVKNEVYYIKLVNDEFVVMLKSSGFMIAYSTVTKKEKKIKLEIGEADIYCKDGIVYAVSEIKVAIYSLSPFRAISTVVFQTKIKNFAICDDVIAVRNLHSQITIYKNFENTYIKLDNENKEGIIDMN